MWIYDFFSLFCEANLYHILLVPSNGLTFRQSKTVDRDKLQTHSFGCSLLSILLSLKKKRFSTVFNFIQKCLALPIRAAEHQKYDSACVCEWVPAYGAYTLHFCFALVFRGHFVRQHNSIFTMYVHAVSGLWLVIAANTMGHYLSDGKLVQCVEMRWHTFANLHKTVLFSMNCGQLAAVPQFMFKKGGGGAEILVSNLQIPNRPRRCTK